MVKVVNQVGSRRITSYLPCSLKDAQALVNLAFHGLSSLMVRQSKREDKDKAKKANYCSLSLENSSTGEKTPRFEFVAKSSRSQEQITLAFQNETIDGVKFDIVNWHYFGEISID